MIFRAFLILPFFVLFSYSFSQTTPEFKIDFQKGIVLLFDADSFAEHFSEDSSTINQAVLKKGPHVCYLNETSIDGLCYQGEKSQESSNVISAPKGFYQNFKKIHQVIYQQILALDQSFHAQFPSLPYTSTILKFVGMIVVTSTVVTYVFKRRRGDRRTPARMTPEVGAMIDSYGGADFFKDIGRQNVLPHQGIPNTDSLSVGPDTFATHFAKTHPSITFLSTKEELDEGILRFSFYDDKVKPVTSMTPEEVDRFWFEPLDKNAGDPSLWLQES